MIQVKRDIQIISAPSILSLKLSGVELLGEILLRNGLAKVLDTTKEVIRVATRNVEYGREGDRKTNIFNPESIRKFSLAISKIITATLVNNKTPFVLGGDCSILISSAIAMKAWGSGIDYDSNHKTLHPS